jgi:hypothetical protein
MKTIGRNSHLHTGSLQPHPENRAGVYWVIFFLLLFFAIPLRAVIPVFPTTNSVSGPWLDSWSFGDTNYWTTDRGYFPVSYGNMGIYNLGPGNSLDIDCQTNAWLQYNVYEADGTTNLNVVSDGSAMFWFAPNWASTSDTNDLGTGPGVWSRLLEIGDYTTNASVGWWSLYMDDVGNNFYFTAQDAYGDEADYFSAPVTFTSNSWHLIVLNWSSTNTALFVDGVCLTNGPGVSVFPSADVLANGFTIGSDAATGTLQMHGAMNSLTTYNYPLDVGTISAEWVLTGIFYGRNPDNLGNFTNYTFSPELAGVYDVVGGPGFLTVTGTNTTTCTDSSAGVWITNVTTFPGTNNSLNMSFMVEGGTAGLPYDVFATTYLFDPIKNSTWSWMGQAYPCETNVIYGLTNRAVYLLLGTPLSYDGDGFTVAYDNLILHINPYNPDIAGDGIANGFKFLAGLPMTTPVSIPSLNSATCPVCPVP